MQMKEVKEAFDFVCSSQFWRMSILWPLSLITSYIQLLRHTIFSKKPNSYQRSSPSTTPSFKPLCIITGASSGIGAAAAHSLSNQGFSVVLAGRSPKSLSKIVDSIRELNNDACLKVLEVDISSFESMMKFKSSLMQWLSDSGMHNSVQLLINNAGILATSHRRTAEGYDEMTMTNYIGPFCLTSILLPLLENSPVPSRVVNVSSFTHRNVSTMIVDRGAVISGSNEFTSGCYPWAGIYEYTKLCILLFSYELHRQFALSDKRRAISVIAVDPGAVETNIMREIPSPISRTAFFVLNLLGLLQPPEHGARPIIDAALASPEVSGVYFFGGNGKTINSSAHSYDPKQSKDLWATSTEIFQELQRAYS